MPVIDEAHIGVSNLNLAENVLTAVRMLHQIRNSDAEVEMMIINLLTFLEHNLAAYPLDELEGLLLALSQSSGPRPMSHRNLDFFKTDLLPTTKSYFRGYEPLEAPVYPDLYGRNADTSLNTTESILAHTNAIAGLESDFRYDTTRQELTVTNAAAEGNLQVQQVGNMITLFAADGIRRTEKSLAGLVNVAAARNAHDLQKDVWGEVQTRQALELAYLEDPPSYNSGRGGVKFVGTYGNQGVNF